MQQALRRAIAVKAKVDESFVQLNLTTMGRRLSASASNVIVRYRIKIPYAGAASGLNQTTGTTMAVVAATLANVSSVELTAEVSAQVSSAGSDIKLTVTNIIPPEVMFEITPDDLGPGTSTAADVTTTILQGVIRRSRATSHQVHFFLVLVIALLQFHLCLNQNEKT